MFDFVESNITTTLTGTWTADAKTLDNKFTFEDIKKALETRNVRTKLHFTGLGQTRTLYGFVSSVIDSQSKFTVITGTPLGTEDILTFANVGGVWTA